MRNIKSRRFDPVKLLVIGAIVLVLALPFASIIVDRATEKTITVTVVDKAIKRSNEDNIYLIYTDNGTYEITDSIAYQRWDSSDLYGKIKKNKTYEFKVIGFRVPFFSMYKNVIEAKEITE